MVGDIPDAAGAASVAGEEDNVPDFVLAGDEAAGAALAVVLDVQGTADAESGAALLGVVASRVVAVAVALDEEGIDAGAFDGTVALYHHTVAREEVEDGDRGVATQVAAAVVVVVAAAAALGNGFAGEERRAGAAESEDGKEAAAVEAVGRHYDEVDIDVVAVAAAAVEGIADKGYASDCRTGDDGGFGEVKVAVPSAERDIAVAAAAEEAASAEERTVRAGPESTPATRNWTPWKGAYRSPQVSRCAPSPREAP